ncbi:hypothetical protein CgunFtcFv8_004996 [Champsocephalus gunnari]|uniref:Uncharacterized protein n=1 Tax=Champsocephalus gunnari TaxID=52237 RepID=A0AAN8CUR3_CHAGU|nr:hypothetical protein CgunFtcFv8_004996 [Champsocephalus gunnari]
MDDPAVLCPGSRALDRESWLWSWIIGPGWISSPPPDPLLQPSISGTDLDKFRKALMGHCDINGDEKIQKNELALGLKLS